MTPLLLVALWLPLCTGIVEEGSVVVSPNGTTFLTKFCFDYDKTDFAGYFNISLTLPDAVELKLLLFDDQASSYPGDAAGTWKTLSCEEKIGHARYAATVRKSNFSVPLVVPIHEGLRPRWWYVALSDCSGSAATVKYKVHMWNPLHGWQRELSHDHYGVVQLCLLLLVAYVVLTVAQVRSMTTHRLQGHSSHPLLQLLLVGVLTAVVAMLFLIAYYSIIASGGTVVIAIYAVAKLCQVLSKGALMAILVLASKGRYITHDFIEFDVIWLSLIIIPFCTFCFGLEIYGEFSPTRKYTTGYIYATPAGRLLTLFDLGFLLLDIKNLQKTVSSEKGATRKDFYYRWAPVCGAWFLVLPVLAVLAQVLSPWVEFFYVTAVSHIAHALMFALLIIGLWPNEKQEYFVFEAVELVRLDGSGQYDQLVG